MGAALQGAINNALVKLACVRVIVVIKAIRVTPTCCWVCILCRQVGAPPVVAALCLGTSLSLEIPVLHRGGKRQERAEMEQAVCICTCRHGRFFFFCLYSDMEEVEPENPKASLQCLNEVHCPCRHTSRFPSLPPISS